jgi:hypothetical protein
MPNPNPENTLRMVLEAYKRVYQANREKYLSIAEMRNAMADELNRNTNCYIRYPDDPQPALEETLVEIPEFIHMVVTHNVGVCIIKSFKITEEQTHEIYQQIEQADIPLGLAIALHSPVPIWKQVDVDIPLWQRQVMEAISWDEE